MNNICSEPACPIILDSTCVFYTGANLVYTGVNTNDNLQLVLEKIDNKFRDAGLGYVFTNGLIQTAPGQPVKLGGVLVNNTTINSQGFTFGLSGTIGASAFITTGGTSSQFVKGDGSLDSGPYQPAGNYITALTGDGTASGPGSSVFTLATVFNAPATYGSSTRVPIITVNDKGLVTNVTTTIISVPSSSISIDGDVYGYGNTGVPFNLTLQNVLATPGVYGSVSAIPVINVNSKGLITSISQVAIGGGGIGTVTNVSVTSGTGISASVANPTTTPNITITNTAPDQTVVLSSGTGISVTGTYPNFTIANTGLSSIPNLQQVTDQGNVVTDLGNTAFSQLLFDQYNIQEIGGSAVGMNVNSGNPYLYVQNSGGGTTYYSHSQIILGPNSMIFPALTTNRYLTLSVNGTYADSAGNITISTGGVTSVTASTPLASSGGTTPNITIQQASGSQAGYLSSIDWTTFNSKQNTITLTTTGTSGAATFISNTLNIPQYQAAGTYVTSVGATGPITSSGGTTPTISTSMATNKLIGRSTAGVGVMEEITVGTGLSLSGGTLSSSVVGGILHGTASGTDTYTVTIIGATAYADGDAYLIRFPNGNTTGCTLDINSQGAITLYRNNDGPLTGGDIWDGAEMLCVYNSTITGFQCIGTSPNAMYAYITNADSVTITKGQVVYAFGGTGDRLTVKLANNAGDSTSAQTVGVVLSTSIAANQKGIIITQGLLDGLSILPTSTYNDGDPLYLGSTAGSVTNVKPYAPNHLVYLGNVTTASNGAAGRWYVRVQNGYELDELHNVQARTPSLKDTLWYDNTVSPAQWKTASIPTILGYTPQAQLNGTGFVKALGTAISYDNSTYLTSVGTGTTNEITYWSGTNTIASLSTATYPSLTELSYVKGVTSAIQTQLNSKGYTLGLTSIASNLVSGTTYYFGNVGRAIIATADVSRVYIPKTGVIKKAYITQYSATTGTITSITLNIRLNNTTDTLVATSTANATFRTYNNNALSINVTEGDYIEIKVTSVSLVAPTANVFGGTIYIE